MVPCQFAEAQNLVAGQIADGHLAVEWHQMVFTHGEHFDVLHNHHLIVVLVEDGAIKDIYKEDKWSID